jgi:hypothetical protein
MWRGPLVADTALARCPEMSALGKSDCEIKKTMVPQDVWDVHDRRRRKANMSWPQYTRQLFTITALGLETAKTIEGLRLEMVAGIEPESGGSSPR